MKKLLALFLALLIVVGMAPLALADDVIELNMYFPVSVGGGPDQLISALCDEFHTEYPNIKINPIYAGSYADTTTKVNKTSVTQVTLSIQPVLHHRGRPGLAERLL